MAGETLLSKLLALATRVGTELKALRAEVPQQIADAKTALKNEILGGADEAYDTLKEIQGFLETNNDTVAALQALKVVKYDAAQGLTSDEQALARSNINAADAATVTTQGERLTTAESGITDHGNRLNTVETDLDSLEATIGDMTDVDFVATFEAALTAGAEG